MLSFLKAREGHICKDLVRLKESPLRVVKEALLRVCECVLSQSRSDSPCRLGDAPCYRLSSLTLAAGALNASPAPRLPNPPSTSTPFLRRRKEPLLSTILDLGHGEPEAP